MSPIERTPHDPAHQRDAIYRGRRYSPETIELCIRWYISYRPSYRDLTEMMAERDVIVSHTTIMRWVLRYVPEYERRWSRFARPPGRSWRVDETAVSVRGGRHYLFRGVDKSGKSIGSLLCNNRDRESAQAFFRAVVADGRVPWPEKINIDGNKATLRGLRLLGEEDPRWREVEVRTRRYLNNVVEQDHRAIKQRCVSMLGLKSFRSAAVTLAGIELAHNIRKEQHLLPLKREGKRRSLRDMWECALNPASEPVLADVNCYPPMHQISREVKRARAEEFLKSEFYPVRYLKKISFGGNLNLFVTPKGGRYWQYCYRYGGKRRTLSLGLYPAPKSIGAFKPRDGALSPLEIQILHQCLQSRITMTESLALLQQPRAVPHSDLMIQTCAENAVYGLAIERCEESFKKRSQ